MTAITDHFKKSKEFSRQELVEELRQLLPEAGDTAIAWRIHDLKQKGVISNIARNKFTLSNKQEFNPHKSDELKKLFNDIKASLPLIQLCISDVAWINDLMIHQVFKTPIVLEVEKDAAPSVFRTLSAANSHVFLEPDEKVIEFYLQSADKPIVIKYLISQSPKIEQDGIVIPKLEKILVDLLAEKYLYAAQQTEIDYIFDQARKRYAINESTLMRYAGRRSKFEEVHSLLHPQHKKND